MWLWIDRSWRYVRYYSKLGGVVASPVRVQCAAFFVPRESPRYNLAFAAGTLSMMMHVQIILDG